MTLKGLDRLARITVALTNDELLHLDGVCRPEVQAVVDSAKAAIALRTSGLSDADATFIADVVTHARARGQVGHQMVRIRYCRICGKDAGYADRGRNGRRLIEPRPLTMPGVDLDSGSVRIQNTALLGGCDECMTRLIPHVLAALADVPAETPQSLAPKRWVRYSDMRCTVCAWTGHEGQMRRLPTIMGHGTYAGGCPACKAENILGRWLIERTGGFTMVPDDSAPAGAVEAEAMREVMQ